MKRISISLSRKLKRHPVCRMLMTGMLMQNGPGSLRTGPGACRARLRARAREREQLRRPRRGRAVSHHAPQPLWMGDDCTVDRVVVVRRGARAPLARPADDAGPRLRAEGEDRCRGRFRQLWVEPRDAAAKAELRSVAHLIEGPLILPLAHLPLARARGTGRAGQRQGKGRGELGGLVRRTGRRRLRDDGGVCV
jgi:hypothetical protein